MKRASTFYSLALLVTAILSLPALGQITPSDDAYTLTSSPTKNFGTANTLEVESSGATTFIRFDLSGIPSSVTGSMVAKGTLKIFVGTVTTPGSFNIDLVTSSWAEKTITANSEPTLGSAIASAIPVTTADKDQYILVDVTAAVVDWLNGTVNDGLAIVPDGTVSFALNSKETTTTSHPAELDIVLTGPQGPQGPAGPISGVTAGTGLTGGGTKGNVTVSMLTNCASGQVLQWSGSAWACSSAGTGTITGVTAGTDLTGGGTSGKVTLNLDTTKVPQLTATNVFAANQSITGTLSVSNGLSVTGDSFFGASDSGTALQVSQGGTSGTGAILGISRSNAAGSYAVLGTALGTSGAVFGTEGSTKSAAGSGIVGVSGTESTIGNKYGSSAGVWGDAGSVGSHGVIGTADNAYGVVGVNNSAGGLPAIVGQNFGSSSIAPGLLAVSSSPVGIGALGAGPTYSNNFNNNAGANAIGVVGDSAASGGIGVWGSTDGGTSVYGSTTTGTGVYGLSKAGYGVLGSSTSTSGVVGTSSGGGSAGVYGVTYNTNILESAYSVWGEDTTTIGVNGGVFGFSQNGVGVFGISGSSSGLSYAGEFSARNGAVPLAAVGSSGNCIVYGDGSLICTGSKSAAVPLPNDHWVRLYAVESPEELVRRFRIRHSLERERFRRPRTQLPRNGDVIPGLPRLPDTARRV